MDEETETTTEGSTMAWKKKAGPRPDVYQIVTDRITEALEKGTVPWHKPWAGGDAGGPCNLVSKKHYRGVNPFLLAMRGYGSPYWMTYKQAQAKGGNVRKGEKGTPVIFWKWLEKIDEKTGKKKRIPLLRYYTVFNVEQTDGVEFPKPEEIVVKEFKPIESAEKIADSYPGAPTVEHKQQRAFYRQDTDAVNMPKRETFETPEEYYSVLFHEFTHSTGHASRLDRETLVDMAAFGSTNYSKEELVAEMGAAMLCGVAGIENRTVDNSAAYIQGWIDKLRGDSKLLVRAAAQAQKAADHVRGIKFEQKGDN